MSYCVNCGVELGGGASKCPLCDTPVINPNISAPENINPPFPERIEIPKATKNRYSAIIVSIILLIPNIVCVLTNLLFAPEKPWSIYVVASTAITWFLVVFPFFMKSKRKYLTLLVDTIATAAYIFIFYYYNSEQTGWFWKLALPLVVGVFGFIAILVAYFSKKRSLTGSLITVFAVLTALNIFICTVINLYSYSVVATYITMILGISCLIFLLFFIAAEKNEKLKAWLSRKFFY